MPENFEGPVEIPVEENIPNLFDLEEDDEEDEDEDKENLAGKFSSLYLNQCTQSNVGLLSELCGVLLELCSIMGLCQNSCAGSFPGLFIIRFTSENSSARFIQEILFLYLVLKKQCGTSSFNIVYGYGLFIFNWVIKRKYLVIKMAGSVVMFFFFGID